MTQGCCILALAQRCSSACGLKNLKLPTCRYIQLRTWLATLLYIRQD